MTQDEFNALPHDRQFVAVLNSGTYLARRWQEVDKAVQLYQMPGGFFAELTYNASHNEILYTEGFGLKEQEKLADYAMFVKLPDWLG